MAPANLAAFNHLTAKPPFWVALFFSFFNGHRQGTLMNPTIARPVLAGCTRSLQTGTVTGQNAGTDHLAGRSYRTYRIGRTGGTIGPAGRQGLGIGYTANQSHFLVVI